MEAEARGARALVPPMASEAHSAAAQEAVLQVVATANTQAETARRATQAARMEAEAARSQAAVYISPRSPPYLP